MLTLGNGTDGEALGYSPDTGLLYHVSGRDVEDTGVQVYESIAPDSLAVVDIPRSGIDYDEALALGFEPASGDLLLADVQQDLYRITVGGNSTLIGPLDHVSKGIAVPEPAALSLQLAALVSLGALTCVTGRGRIRRHRRFRDREGDDRDHSREEMTGGVSRRGGTVRPACPPSCLPDLPDDPI